MSVKLHSLLQFRIVAMVPKGMMEVFSNQKYRIMISKLSNKPIHLQERMNFELGVEVTSRIMKFTIEGDIDTANEIHQQ